MSSVEYAPRHCAHGRKPGKPGVTEHMAERLHNDLRLAIVTLYCLCSMAIIGSFALYRFSVGDWLVAVVDSLIVLAFVGWTLLAWRPGWTRLAANLTAVSASVAVLVVVVVLGLSYLWVFSVLVSNFLMADRRVALAASTAIVAGVGLQQDLFASLADQMTFIAVATMTSLFSLIFATRVDSHHGKLTLMADRDGLTGAYNRRSLDRNLQSLVHDSRAGERSHCLAIMDIDNFKGLNDRHGHEVGDDILTRLTGIVCDQTRSSDRFYRYGGDEFVLLFPDTTLAGAQAALGNLRETLAGNLEGPDGPVTSSFGLTQLRPGESADDWLGRADRELLAAKRSGKNRVEQA